jgi:hypothetical protein
VRLIPTCSHLIVREPASHPPSALATEIEIARQALTSSPSASSPNPSSIGVGFLCWSLSALSSTSTGPLPSDASHLTASSKEPSSTDRPDSDLNPTFSPSTDKDGHSKELDPLDIALSSPIVSAIWLFAGDTLYWAREIRRREALVLPSSSSQRKKKHPVKIFIQVSTFDSAQQWLTLSSDCASNLIDVLVLQSSEAGGHGSPSSLPLSTILPFVVRSFPTAQIPILAAGGLMVGEHLASALSMGADGGVFGTRFLLSEESCYGREKKVAIRDCEVGGTERSDAWDRAIGKGWPGRYSSLSFFPFVK